MRNLTLLTDLYEITMAYGFYRNGKHEEEAVFDIFFRQNNLITYSLAAGLEQAMEYLLGWHFSNADIDYLRSLKIFGEDFLEYLRNMRFTGDVYAVKEGEPVFPGEPILTIKAPLIQAQFAETALLNIINHQTLIATKASKICRAAGKGAVMEFGLRRAQGPDAGVYGARAAVIGGCSSTSNVLAGQLYDIPVSGTMAHSWVMDFDSEYEAFRAYAEAYPENCLLLVDTYDTLRSGVPNAIRVVPRACGKGVSSQGNPPGQRRFCLSFQKGEEDAGRGGIFRRDHLRVGRSGRIFHFFPHAAGRENRPLGGGHQAHHFGGYARARRRV